MSGLPPPSPSPSLPPPNDRAVPQPVAGWYIDPFGARGWRWFDGASWTSFTSVGSTAIAGSRTTTDRPPRLPSWLSPPVLVCGALTALILLVIAIDSPWAIVAGLVPLVIVMPVLAWLDRVEPEPRSSRLHALLWGATVAIIVALIVNSIVAALFGEGAAMVGSAPLVEEAGKAMGIVWAVRRRQVDGVTDGIVYAGWVALGFAVVEDITYFALADVEGALLPVFVLRALLTPFAHPLFTFWTGLAIGRAVHAGRRLWPHAMWGYGLAVLCHAAWNGSLSLANVTSEVDEDIGATVILLTMLLFFVLFVTVSIAVFISRRREQRRFVASVPSLVLRYHVAPDEAALFVGWRHMLRQRRRLDRTHRASFDRVHAALARLSVLHERPGETDPVAEHVLVAQLSDAVAEYRSIR